MLAVQHAAYAIEAELIGYPDLPPLHETLEGLQASEEEMWLCAKGDELVGVVGLEHGEDEMVIARLFVAPACFRRGVGSALVAHALARAGGRPRPGRHGRAQHAGARPLRALRVPPARRGLADAESRLRRARSRPLKRWKPPEGGFQSWPRQDGQGYVP